MGDRAARKSSVEATGDSPGPVYSLPSSTTDKQVNSDKVSSPRFGFGTQARLGGHAEATISPGPGAYSPRVTHHSSPSSIQTVAAGQLTELTTPRGSIQITEGTWSRVINRSLANPREGPYASRAPALERACPRTQPPHPHRAAPFGSCCCCCCCFSLLLPPPPLLLLPPPLPHFHADCQ